MNSQESSTDTVDTPAPSATHTESPQQSSSTTRKGPRHSPRIFNSWDIDEVVADFKTRYRQTV